MYPFLLFSCYIIATVINVHVLSLTPSHRIHTQYPVAVFLGISLILYPLLQPYRKKIHNHLEVLLTTSTLLLIIIRNTGDFIAKNTHYHRGNTGDFIANNTHHQKGKEDHHDEEDCEHVHRITQTSWQILLFFYFPIGVFLISLLIAVIIQVK